MAVRHIYETAFDSTVSPVDAEDDSIDILETSRRLCSPELTHTQIFRPSPASSRSSTDSERTPGTAKRSRRSPRSPKLPLRKIFTPWPCGSDGSLNGAETPVSCSPIKPEEGKKEDKSKTFSPSVEFKKLDVADKNKKTVDPAILNLATRSSNNTYNNENVSFEALPSTTTGHFYNGEIDINLGTHNATVSNKELFKNLDEDSQHNTFALPRASRDDMKRSNANTEGVRNNLWLDFSRATKRPRRTLCFDSENNQQDADTALEPKAHLLKQEWYHGSISRTEAENLLKFMKKGSFLVRRSEKLKGQYLLSLKTSRGVMHVKIVQLPNGKYVIKQQSQTFDSVPQLIQYFSMHILNIQEMNVYLSHPVIEKLL